MKIFKIWRRVDTVTAIDPVELRSERIKLLIFDFDNTLAYHRSETLDLEVVDFLEHLKNKGFEIFILSNAKKARIFKVLNDLDLNGRGLSCKPLPFVLNSILRDHKIKKTEAVLIGDQLFTDIFAGNLAGIRTILVDRISDSESFFIRLRRKLEKVILKRSM